ncbi:MAG: hypothetical protein M0D57_21275 [Sphingobacteriales bacterium JAD_PAG50586_3]|nr:MAG: hypothetical protein M0D57_21275 [Sphingobacteriales bacterium JAD_PAG50586_3]
MKKLGFILLIFLTAPAFSQGYKGDIKKVLTAYGNVVKDKNVDSLFTYMYPKFFDVFPKQDLVDGMKKTFADTNLTITFGDVVVTSVSDVYEEDKIKYAVVNYTNEIQLTLSPTVGTQMVLESMKNTYETAYGAANVKSNFATRTFNIKATNAMFAINNPAYGNRWWLLEKKTNCVLMLGL